MNAEPRGDSRGHGAFSRKTSVTKNHEAFCCKKVMEEFSKTEMHTLGCGMATRAKMPITEMV